MNLIIDSDTEGKYVRLDDKEIIFDSFNSLRYEKVDSELPERIYGVISGYPFNRMRISSGNHEVRCDALMIKGGYKRKFPFTGNEEFNLIGYCMSEEGELTEKIDLSNETRISITLEKLLNDAIVCNSTGCISPRTLHELVMQQTMTYQGLQRFHMSFKGNSNHPIKKLRIEHYRNGLLFIYGHETLETKTLGRSISHSSMDPGDDEYGTTTTLTCRSLNCLNSDRMSVVLTKLVNIGGGLGIKIYDDVTIYSVVFETAQTPIDIKEKVGINIQCFVTTSEWRD